MRKEPTITSLLQTFYEPFTNTSYAPTRFSQASHRIANCPNHKEVTMLPKVRITRRGLGAIVLAIGAGLLMTAVLPREVSSDLFAARDPGVRPDPAGAGGMLSGLT